MNDSATKTSSTYGREAADLRTKKTVQKRTGCSACFTGAASRVNKNFLYVPVGCTACGGPYPMCKESCPMFDDGR